MLVRLSKTRWQKIGKTSTGLMNLVFCCNMQMVGSELGVNNTNPCCLVPKIQAGGGVVVVVVVGDHCSAHIIPAEMVQIMQPTSCLKHCLSHSLFTGVKG